VYLVQLGKFKDAEKVADQIQNLDTKTPALPMLNGLLALYQGDYKKARQISESNLGEGPTTQEMFVIFSALSRAVAGETGFGKATLDKFSSAGGRQMDTILLLAAVLGDADTMLRLTEDSTSFNNYGWLVRSGAFMKKIARRPAFRKLVVDLYQKWQTDLAALGSSLPAPPPTLPTPEEFLASLQ